MNGEAEDSRVGELVCDDEDGSMAGEEEVDTGEPCDGNSIGLGCNDDIDDDILPAVEAADGLGLPLRDEAAVSGT